MGMVEPGSMMNLPTRCNKKMKKRKELDALVSTSKVRKKGAGGHELLHESDCSEDEYRSSAGFGGLWKIVGRRICAMCGVLLLAVCVVTMTTLMWLHLSMQQDIDAIRRTVSKVESENQGLPEELHTYHTTLQRLERNQTDVWRQLAAVSAEVEQLTRQMRDVRQSMDSLAASLKTAPQLVSLPQQIDDVKKTVATIGSSLSDLQTTAGQLTKQQAEDRHLTEQLGVNVSALQVSVAQLSSSNEAQGSNKEDDASALKTRVDQLTTRLQETADQLQGKIDVVVKDQQEGHDITANSEKVLSNLTSRIVTLEDMCVRANQSQAQSPFQSTASLPASSSSSEGSTEHSGGEGVNRSAGQKGSSVAIQEVSAASGDVNSMGTEDVRTFLEKREREQPGHQR